jgi:hypothetical protein
MLGASTYWRSARAQIVLLAAMLASCPAPAPFSTCLTDRDCAARQQCIGGGCVEADGGERDGGEHDALATDAASLDAEGRDASEDDGGERDASERDAGAIDCGAVCPEIPGEDCAGALPILLGLTGRPGEQAGTIAGDTTSMRDDFRTSCNSTAPSGGDAVYYIELSVPSDVMVETTDASFDAILSISIEGGCGSAELMHGCNDDLDPGGAEGSRVFLHHADPSASARFYILVDGQDGSAGTFTLRVVTTTPPFGDSCGNPLDISGGGTVLGRIGAAAFSLSGSCQAPAEASEPQAILCFDVPADGSVNDLTATSADFDPDLWVRSAFCATGAERSCVHGGGGTTTATGITFGAETRGWAIVDGAAPGDRYRLDYDP